MPRFAARSARPTSTQRPLTRAVGVGERGGELLGRRRRVDDQQHASSAATQLVVLEPVVLRRVRPSSCEPWSPIELARSVILRAHQRLPARVDVTGPAAPAVHRAARAARTRSPAGGTARATPEICHDLHGQFAVGDDVGERRPVPGRAAVSIPEHDRGLLGHRDLRDVQVIETHGRRRPRPEAWPRSPRTARGRRPTAPRAAARRSGPRAPPNADTCRSAAASNSANSSATCLYARYCSSRANSRSRASSSARSSASSTSPGGQQSRGLEVEQGRRDDEEFRGVVEFHPVPSALV